MSGRLNTVARLTAALEALSDGDQRLAVRILEDLRREDGRRPGRLSHRCPVCGVRFDWPGQVDAHRRFRHPPEERSAA